jgi:murein DD-endopeptidase MepM/ murein hydrolase activator NlpD
MRNTESRFRQLLLLAALAGLVSPAWAQAQYPSIRALRSGDVIFDQLADSIENFHRSELGGQSAPQLSFYSYTLAEDADIFSLAAAFSLPYDTLATLNRMPNADIIGAGTAILVPSLPGVFVAQSPENDLEYLAKSLWSEDGRPHSAARALLKGRYVDFDFFPGAEFHASERTFFLVAGFRFPLPKGVITSGFGSRVDPFTGRVVKFHTGIDIAAPFGTMVYAARSGRVESTGYSDVYGNFIILAHDSTWETLYGHLSKILVAKGQTIKTGDTIGLVGSTGMSTGPHLHFETRKRGEATDPAPLMMGR